MNEHYLYLILAAIPWLGYAFIKYLGHLAIKEKQEQIPTVMPNEEWNARCNAIQKHIDQSQSQLLAELKSKYGYVPKK
ncbi:MAG: hypothetical protein K0S22_1759 [Oscillospiraceae bacterium]|jgi:transcription elongation factor GreA-like protein|nr:hypothetical protein [Oscillospiraceae bacterium]